jgi:hypothetical protein
MFSAPIRQRNPPKVPEFLDLARERLQTPLDGQRENSLRLGKKIILKDMDYDGTIDLVSTNAGCTIKGVSVKLKKRLDTGEDNFCFAPEQSTLRKAVR